MAILYTMDSFKVSLRWQLPLLTIPTVYWAVYECNYSTKLPETLLDSGNFSADVLTPSATWILKEISLTSPLNIVDDTYYAVVLAAAPYADGSVGLVDIKEAVSVPADNVVYSVANPAGVWTLGSIYGYIGLYCFDGVVEFITRSDTIISPINLNIYADAPRYFGDIFRFPPSAPSKPTNPTPLDAADDVTLDHATLTWEDGGDTDTFNIYYGTESGNLTLVQSGIAVGSPSFTITGITSGSPFDYLDTRYWRVDSINANGTTTGDEWSFTTLRLLPPGPTFWYSTGGYWYQLLVQDDGSYGDPPGVGVENTDYIVISFTANFIRTNRVLIAAANNKIWYEAI